jgi:hypothetical protein
MIKKLSIIIIPFLLLSCGMSKQEKNEIATITCNVMAESRNMDAAFRIKELNSARELLGEDRYLEGDNVIKEAFQFDLCKELVLNNPNFIEILEKKKDSLKTVQDSTLIDRTGETG